MFLKTVLADGTAEQTVIREMKARAAGARGDIEQIVRGVMADVQERGWDAVVEYAEKFDGKAPYIVEPSVLDAAYDACDPKLISALEKAAANIRDYHEQMLVKSWEWKRTAGETLGQTVRGLSRVGIYVPGGTAAYPSSVLMNAIPAKVAGVGELIMVTPPTENMSNEVLAAAKIAGVDKVIAIGGTQAIAALTYGAGFIPQVDKIVGPGNAFVAAAKKLAFGTVDIDMIAGPSEVLVIADHTANPTYVAADLLSQAEHDRLASAVLLTDSMAQAQAISCEMERQAKLLPRWDIIKDSVANYGCAIVFDELTDACKMADVVAPEHLEVVTAAPRELLPYLQRLAREINIPMLYVSHSLDEILHLADKVLVLEEGCVKAFGSLEEVWGSSVMHPWLPKEQQSSILKVSVLEHHPHYAMTALALGDQHLWVNKIDKPLQSALRIRIQASDVSLVLQPPLQTSVRNILRAKVAECFDDNGQVEVKLEVGSRTLWARISPWARDELGIKPGLWLYAQIKSVSITA